MNIDRRKFLKGSTIVIGSSALADFDIIKSQDVSTKRLQTDNNDKNIRLGFVGVGGRGSYHLDAALGIPGVTVTAICDIRDENLYRAKKWVEEAGQPSPTLYNRSETDFKRLCEEQELDAVINCTPWEWHVPVCLAAMNNNKHVVTEVPIILTIEEGWEIIETFERTGKWATLALEQVLLESQDGLDVLNMIRNGIFGEMLYADNGYVHDLRHQQFDPDHEPWRLQHTVIRNGNQYPDHPMAKIMPYLDINHGDRFDHLVSMSTKSMCINEYARKIGGKDNYYATKEIAQGDVNSTLIRTVNGKMVNLGFDTSTPHPREFARIQGSKGTYISGPGLSPKIYIDGRSPVNPESPRMHNWEEAAEYLKEYRHPFLKSYVPLERKSGIRGHGGSAGKTKTPLTWYLLVKALRENIVPYWFDVYDSVTSSAVIPLSVQSVAGKSKAIDFPDFTKGRWKTRPGIDFV